MNIMSCPCRSGSFFASCCAPFLEGQQQVPTPEKLMRSRYSAYCLENTGYLLHTQTGPAAQQFNTQNTGYLMRDTQWLGLTVHGSWFDPGNPDIGYVEFTANYRAAGQLHAMREISEFHHIGQRWLYYAGEQPKQSSKIGRNDPCPCGSGKKYKKCCGK